VQPDEIGWRCEPAYEGRRRDGVFREGAVHAVSGVVLERTQCFPARDAELARPAGIVQPGDADRIALLQAGHAWTYRGDYAGAFMARDEWR
jgi:hypothetical protein